MYQEKERPERDKRVYEEKAEFIMTNTGELIKRKRGQRETSEYLKRTTEGVYQDNTGGHIKRKRGQRDNKEESQEVQRHLCAPRPVDEILNI
eukprot:817280-Amorphochlora_amoeboformis.AAC.2